LSDIFQKILDFYKNYSYNGHHQLNICVTFTEKCPRKRAAEGVTLSGVRKDGDCRPTELWRTPLNWVPKVQSAQALISQAKGQSAFS